MLLFTIISPTDTWYFPFGPFSAAAHSLTCYAQILRTNNCVPECIQSSLAHKLYTYIIYPFTLFKPMNLPELIPPRNISHLPFGPFFLLSHSHLLAAYTCILNVQNQTPNTNYFIHISLHCIHPCICPWLPRRGIIRTFLLANFSLLHMHLPTAHAICKQLRS